MIPRYRIALVVCVSLLLMLNGCASLRIDINMYKGVPPDVNRKATDLMETIQEQQIFTQQGRELLKVQFLEEIRGVIVNTNSVTYQLLGDPQATAASKAEKDWNNIKPRYAIDWDSIYVQEEECYLNLDDPFNTYDAEVEEFIRQCEHRPLD